MPRLRGKQEARAARDRVAPVCALQYISVINNSVVNMSQNHTLIGEVKGVLEGFLARGHTPEEIGEAIAQAVDGMAYEDKRALVIEVMNAIGLEE